MQCSFSASEGEKLWEKDKKSLVDWRRRHDWDLRERKPSDDERVMRSPFPTVTQLQAQYPTRHKRNAGIASLERDADSRKVKIWMQLQLLEREELQIRILRELNDVEKREEEKKAEDMKQSIVEALEKLSSEYTQPPEDKNDMHYGYYTCEFTFANLDFFKEMLGLTTSLRTYISTKRLDPDQPVGVSWTFSPQGKGIMVHLAVTTPIRK